MGSSIKVKYKKGITIIDTDIPILIVAKSGRVKSIERKWSDDGPNLLRRVKAKGVQVYRFRGF